MSSPEPSIPLVWSTFTAYQRTAAMKAAIELDVFSAVAAGADTLGGLAARCRAAPRGLRPLLDHLVMDGFLAREGDRWKLTPTAATFLDRGSPLYLGSAITFIASPHVVSGFTHLTEAVRRGGTAAPDAGSLVPDHPMWVEFARAMAPVAGMSAELLATFLDVERAPGWQVLDLAAGHGLFGITIARRNPRVEVTAVDWASVLAVAEENARAAGVAERFHPLPGSVFDVRFGGPYDRVLVPNLLHHFDPPTCERLLARVRDALVPGGRVVIVEFVPDDDRQGPPDAVRFGLVMLAGTPGGDAYTFAEYRAMLVRAGFRGAAVHDVPPTPMRVVLAER
jgi:SAM-dependent methyltransferase